MPLYPLCISRSRDVPSASDDVIGPPAVQWCGVGELACAFVEAKQGSFKPAHHAAALEAIHRHAGALPMRFGTALGDESEIRSMLQERSGELLDRLDRLDGACEMGLRITLPDSMSDGDRRVPPLRRSSVECNPLPGTAGKQAVAHGGEKGALAYLERRRSLYRTEDANDQIASRLVERVVLRLQDVHCDWRRLPSPSSQVVRLAFLVERDGVEAFRARLEDFDNGCPGASCLVLGPWPPYSFA